MEDASDIRWWDYDAKGGLARVGVGFQKGEPKSRAFFFGEGWVIGFWE
jgi:hypothetical protein